VLLLRNRKLVAEEFWWGILSGAADYKHVARMIIIRFGRAHSLIAANPQVKTL
jgi:hypothetical protein